MKESCRGAGGRGAGRGGVCRGEEWCAGEERRWGDVRGGERRSGGVTVVVTATEAPRSHRAFVP